MITELGKELRKLRVDHDERLLHMADRIGKSASFVSAVETGKKAPPSGFEDLIINAYGLATAYADLLRNAADRSRKEFMLTPKTQIGQDVAGLLARKMESLSDEQLKRISTIIQSNGKNK